MCHWALHRGLVPAALCLLTGVVMAASSRESMRTAATLPRIDDYAAACAAAEHAGAMLLVSIEPMADDTSDLVGSRLARADVQEQFASSGSPWVVCRLGIDDAAALVNDPSLREMRHGPGVFVVDYAHAAWKGRIVSVLPRTAGTYYRFEPHHLDELAALPEGSLTQRSMVLAVRLHNEHPRSTEGFCDPLLGAEAESHSAHQARIQKQGHHDWAIRSQRLGGPAAEVCAESWEHQDLLDSCVDCVHSWRHSPGHWQAVGSSHAAYGYDIRRGGNGVWYATGIFRD